MQDQVTELAVSAQRGDNRALTAFIAATQHEVRRFCAHLSDPTHAEDLAQETYLRAITALPSFRRGSSARTWLLAIARRTVADHLRAAAARPRLAAADWRAALDERRTVTGPAPLVEARLLLESLDRERREALVLTQAFGLTYAEAADVCGCPVGTIRSRVARAREQLVAQQHSASQEATA
ncbi:sigma-70 family RNA polymerase sigma factor [Tsukamurella sp. 8F]|uniref:sigma-70 family RNA polymerase sigma factor n=1 Tax=unclassified Tsukamurella TaxID=2633480 RepID=UPI0023B985A4|nr:MULTISPECIES: sigma-70 family RNA polymerase sigma factor [unclassified Tsukamurella]MDF0530632.1 sigma-70 family RNA polymerase sigma factor [Tsukamurella sp. 8J]MDF0587833.1 sigma-70 family RNA polymerase sigma factor [Tsukamurella sp. 8F]